MVYIVLKTQIREFMGQWGRGILWMEFAYELTTVRAQNNGCAVYCFNFIVILIIKH